MSNYHEVHCKDCESQCPGIGMNRGAKALAVLIAKRLQVEQVASWGDDWNFSVSVECQGTPVNVAWFAEHAGHRLEVRCEYASPCQCEGGK